MTTAAKIRWGWGTGLALTFFNLVIAFIVYYTYGTTIGGSFNTTEASEGFLREGLWTLFNVAICAVCTIAIFFKSCTGAACLLCFYIYIFICIPALGQHIPLAGWVIWAGRIITAVICIPLWLGVQGTFEAHGAAQPAPDSNVPRSF